MKKLWARKKYVHMMCDWCNWHRGSLTLFKGSQQRHFLMSHFVPEPLCVCWGRLSYGDGSVGGLTKRKHLSSSRNYPGRLFRQAEQLFFPGSCWDPVPLQLVALPSLWEEEERKDGSSILTLLRILRIFPHHFNTYSNGESLVTYQQGGNLV